MRRFKEFLLDAIAFIIVFALLVLYGLYSREKRRNLQYRVKEKKDEVKKRLRSFNTRELVNDFNRWWRSRSNKK